jgi:hypothetical protein
MPDDLPRAPSPPTGTVSLADDTLEMGVVVVHHMRLAGMVMVHPMYLALLYSTERYCIV